MDTVPQISLFSVSFEPLDFDFISLFLWLDHFWLLLSLFPPQLSPTEER